MKQSAAVSMIAFVAAVNVLVPSFRAASMSPTNFMKRPKPAMRITVAMPEGTSSLVMRDMIAGSRWRQW